MHSSGWIELFHLIPPEQQDKIILVTINATEIHLSGILRTEKDFALIRGRLAASTEAGRFFFLPYDQISYLGFRDGTEEAKVLALFLPPEMIPAEKEEGKTPLPMGERTGTDSSPPLPPVPTQEGTGLLGRQMQPGKAALLERLRRTRLGTDTPRPPDK